MTAPARRGRAVALGAAATLLLVALGAGTSGCASRSGSAPAEAAPPAPASAATADPWVAPLEAFEQRQRDAAAAAARQGLWLEAAWAWEVLAALNPRDAEIAQRLAEARKAAASAAADRSARAKAAWQRGDSDGATRLYVEALSLVPALPEATEALRAIERERVRRQHLGQVSRYALARRPDAPPTAAGLAPAVAPAVAGTAAPAPAGAERNEIEHASLLANQGEIEGAIAVLKPIATGAQADAGARRLLADLYVKRADTLAASDRAAAIEALERALAADPTHPRAAARLKLLKDAAKKGLATAATAAPASAPPSADERKTRPKTPDAAKAR